MTMVIELARFTVKPGEEEAFLAERPAMVNALQQHFPACMAAFLTREDSESGGSWLDVLLWRSRDEAEEAAKLIDTVPECAAWFEHIAESGELRHVEVHDHFVSTALG